MPFLTRTSVSDDWLVDLTRCRYLDRGTNPEEGLDCVGLFVHVYNTIGIPITADDILNWRNYLEEVPRDGWGQVKRYWAIGLEDEGGVLTHCGVAISPTDFVHATSKFRSVVCEPISRYSKFIRYMARPRI